MSSQACSKSKGMIAHITDSVVKCYFTVLYYTVLYCTVPVYAGTFVMTAL